MAPDFGPHLTRRRLLGCSGLGALGLAGMSTPASWLPDPLVDLRLRLSRDPTVRWRPPVTDDHVAASRRVFESNYQKAERAWDGLDASNTSSDSLADRSWLTSARQYHKRAKHAPATRDTLFDFLLGSQSAGSAVGSARVLRGETDAEALQRRGKAIQKDIADVAADIEYRVADPETGLAHLYAVERHLGLASLESYADGTFTGGRRSADTFDDTTIVETWGSHFQAKQELTNGKQYLRTYRDRRDSKTRFAADGIDTARTAFRGEVDSKRQSSEQRDRMFESLPDGQYRTVRLRLWQFTHGDLDPSWDAGWLRGLSLRQTVTAARNVLKVRAYSTVLDELGIGTGDAVDMGLVARARRRAIAETRQSLDGAGPFSHVLLADVGKLLEDARLGLGDSSESGRRERAQAYADYLLADGYCRHFADVRNQLPS